MGGEHPPIRLEQALIVIHLPTGVFVLPNVAGAMQLTPVVTALRTPGQPAVNGIASWVIELSGNGPFYSWTGERFASFNDYPSTIKREVN